MTQTRGSAVLHCPPATAMPCTKKTDQSCQQSIFRDEQLYKVPEVQNTERAECNSATTTLLRRDSCAATAALSEGDLALHEQVFFLS